MTGIRPDTVAVRAHAKLTLQLRVLGRRPDGYHDLDAVMVSLAEPHDEVELRWDDSGAVTLDVTGEGADVLGGPDNLAARAARALLDRVGSGRGVHLRLLKGIPAGAGLGGGSADAAAVLVGLSALLGDPLPATELAQIGATLGADVPFCLAGGAARVTGIGERMAPLPVPDLDAPGEFVPFLVVVPDFAVSTPAVYQAWDDLGGPRSHRVVVSPGPLAALAAEMVNDLEPAAEHVEPRLASFRREVETFAGLPAVLAGSGGTYAVALTAGELFPAAIAGSRLVAITSIAARGVEIQA